MSAAELLPALASICGRGGLLTGDGIGEQYTRDWAKTTSGRALAVALPATTAQTAAVLRECNKHGAPVVPQGGHTGLSGGGTPSQDGRQIVLSLRRMSAVREVCAANKTMTAEAGCLLETAQQRAEAAGLLFPLNLAAKGSCQLGGNLATNAGGVNVLRYGTARDLCLGVEAVLANGETLNLLSGLRKDNSGYDLKNLIIGSEGTLAVITAATFKLFLPSAPALTAWAATPSVQAALDLLELMQRQTDGALSAFEMLSQPMFDLQKKHFPRARQPFSPPPQRAVLLEASGGDATAEAAMQALAAAQEGGLATQVAVAASEKQRREFWQTRELAPVANVAQGEWLRTDISLPFSALARFVEEMETRLPQICPGLYIVGFGHLGDGNLHLSARPHDEPPSRRPQEARAIADFVYDRVAAHAGAFSAEHGIGARKVGVMAKHKDAAALVAMRQIKRALDPRDILNPGRLLPPAA